MYVFKSMSLGIQPFHLVFFVIALYRMRTFVT